MTQIVPLPDVTDATLPSQLHGGVATIGNFDGVHRGHAHLLSHTRRLAAELGGPTIACLFDPHPIAILRPELTPQRLSTVNERARRMTRLGVDFLVVCRASRELLNLSAEAFFDALVRDNLRCRGLVEGENFCFGKGRRGDVNLLRQLCATHGLEFRIAPMESAQGAPISSTRIREALAAGDVVRAAQMMDTAHRISGVVSRGDGRGRTIGFPTANLDQVDVIIPAPGVYAGWASRDSGDRQATGDDAPALAAAIHIGESPTFQSGSRSKVEVHLLDHSGDLYGETLTVHFVDRVRGVQRFGSADELIAQLNQDLLRIRRILDPPPPQGNS